MFYIYLYILHSILNTSYIEYYSVYKVWIQDYFCMCTSKSMTPSVIIIVTWNEAWNVKACVYILTGTL